jgi:hypothetical protein
MNRFELEHIVRAACAITKQENVVIIGSQAILASFDYNELPEDTTLSIEVDVFFLDDDNNRLSDLVDGAIGELSFFQDSFGIYAHGVGESTAVLPEGWKERLVKLNNNIDNSCGLCLDPYDLCVSKLYAYREKDLKYVTSLINSNLISLNMLYERLDLVEPIKENEEINRLVISYLDGLRNKGT